jgi:hypothetical protein
MTPFPTYQPVNDRYMCNYCRWLSVTVEPVLADWVRSPMAVLWPFSSQNLDLADWPVWRNATGSYGSPGDRPLFRFITGKLIQFRYLKAAVRHCV